ncbi:MAG: alkaline phosphatase family protein [Candidatus Xenobia bacterium]
MLLIQVDGLSDQDFKAALAEGRMPNMARWLKSGALKEEPYQCSMPSQTVVSQGGVLMGASVLPSNQFYEKGSWKLEDPFSHSADSVEHMLEKQSSGSLVAGGSIYCSPMSAEVDRKHAIFTYSYLQGAQNQGGKKAYLKELARGLAHVTFHMAGHPVQCARTAVDLVAETHDDFEMRQQHYADRGWKKNLFEGFKDGVTDIYLPDASVRSMAADMKKGKVPALYMDNEALDNANHQFADREWSRSRLSHIDRNLGILMKAAKAGPRQYNVVIYADHGCCPGEFFKDKFGQDFPTWLSTLVPARDFKCQDFGPGTQIYFTDSNASLNRDDVNKLHPGVIDAIKNHPDIAFVVTRQGDTTVLDGPHGSVVVDGQGNVTVTGTNPLAQFGGDLNLKAIQVAHMAHREHAADVIVFGAQAAPDKMLNFGTEPGLHGGFGLGQESPMLAFEPQLGLDGSRTVEGQDLYEQLRAHLPADSPSHC